VTWWFSPLKVVVVRTDDARVPPDHPTATAAAIPAGMIESLLADCGVRQEAVARARARLAGASPCPAEELAATLVDCMVAGRLP